MTDIRLVYDPFEDRMHIYYEEEVITEAENRICDFLRTHGFRKCLLPFRTKYAVWEGLAVELVQEVNDGELRIVFEGQEEDYRLIREAFRKAEAAVRELGYQGSFGLAHTGNFELPNVAKKLGDIVRSLREMCESRAELAKADGLLAQIDAGQLKQSCTALEGLILGHIEKWEQSGSDYRQEKIAYLGMLGSELKEAERQLEKIQDSGK